MRGHNGAVTEQQLTAPCPQCGSTTAVHSISELADLARMKLGEGQQGPAGGSPTGPQPGYLGEPQAGPLPGYAGQPQAGPPPGYAGQPLAGPLAGGWSRRTGDFDNPIGDGIDQAIADVALGAAARFIGRAVSRRVQRTMNERVLPAVANRAEQMQRTQIAIAERYPDLRACLDDKVIFLAGGTRTLPLPTLGPTLTMEQADALVAQLKAG